MTSSAMCLHLTGGRTPMDRISESLLAEFSSEHGLTSLDQDKQFEHFTSFITVRRHYSETFETEDIVTGAGGDTGIDGIAIIVNGILVTDVEALEEQVVLMRLLDEANSTVHVRIGHEQMEANLQSTSLVTVGYGGDSAQLGALGVLGPTRMDYAGSIAAVDAVARYVGRFLIEGA